MKLSFLIIPILSVFLFSCAASYKPINVRGMNFNQSEYNDGLDYDYQYNVLALSKNKKYANKELKKAIKVVALKVTNNTGRTLNFRNDIQVFMGDKRMSPLEPFNIVQQIKQPAPLYLLWGLLWVTIYDCEGYDCSVIPLPVGFAIGFINVGLASSANKNFLNELSIDSILDKDIKDGESVHGFLGIQSEFSGPLKLKVNNPY